MKISEMRKRLDTQEIEFGDVELEFYFTQPDALCGPFRDGTFMYGNDTKKVYFIASDRGTSSND